MRPQTKQPGKARKTRSASGFSLIELLIVVAIILIICAIAIPNFIRSKLTANQAAAVANLRNVTTAETVYTTTYGIGFTMTLAQLCGTTPTPDANDAGLIDSVLASGIKSGYTYTYVATSTDSTGAVLTFTLNGDPLIQGQTGDQHFYTDQSNVIRVNQSVPAGPSDGPIQ